MKNWCKWMINHKLAWLLKLMVVLSFPFVLLAFCEEAWEAVTYTLGAIDGEKE